MKRFAISMQTDWIFDGIEAWINEGNGRMAKIWGESIVAHFARKVRATNTCCEVWGDSTVAHFACKVRATDMWRKSGT